MPLSAVDWGLGVCGLAATTPDTLADDCRGLTWLTTPILATTATRSRYKSDQKSTAFCRVRTRASPLFPGQIVCALVQYVSVLYRTCGTPAAATKCNSNRANGLRAPQCIKASTERNNPRAPLHFVRRRIPGQCKSRVHADSACPASAVATAPLAFTRFVAQEPLPSTLHEPYP